MASFDTVVEFRQRSFAGFERYLKANGGED